MAFNAKKYAADQFSEGVWVAIMGGEFKVARAGNPEYEQALEDSGYRKIDDPADKQQALYRAIAKGVLKNWNGVVDEHAQEIPYSLVNAVEVLTENPDLVGRVLNEANNLQNWRREDTAEQAGKPASSYAGKASSKE